MLSLKAKELVFPGGHNRRVLSKMAQTKAQNDPWSTLPEKTAVVLQPPADPRYQLIDSGRYIESLGV